MIKKRKNNDTYYHLFFIFITSKMQTFIKKQSKFHLKISKNIYEIFII